MSGQAEPEIAAPPALAPPALAPPALAPPALAYGTASARPPLRGFAIAILAHILLFSVVFVVWRPHRLRPPAEPPTIAMVLEKPPAPPAPPKPQAAPPKPVVAALPVPPPPAPLPPAPLRRATPVRQVAARPAASPPAARPPASQQPGPLVPAQADPAIRNPPPVYPQLAREKGEEGWVLLTVHVEPDGTPDAASVTQSSGFPLLDHAARNTVLQRYHFDPSLKASMIDLWVSFHLN